MSLQWASRARGGEARHLRALDDTVTPQFLLIVPPHFLPHDCWSPVYSRHARPIQALCFQIARAPRPLGATPPSWSRRKNNVRNSFAARPFSAGKESRWSAAGCLVRRIS